MNPVVKRTNSLKEKHGLSLSLCFTAHLNPVSFCSGSAVKVSVGSLTSGFMEAQSHVSIEAQTEVVVENVDGELRKIKRQPQQCQPVSIRSDDTHKTHLVCLVFVHVLRPGLGVRLHIQVPAVQLDDVSILHM